MRTGRAGNEGNRTSACLPRTLGYFQTPETQTNTENHRLVCTRTGTAWSVPGLALPGLYQDWQRLVCTRTGTTRPNLLLETHPVPGQGLGAVFVDDLDVTRRLDPGLPVHLNRDAFVPQDGDLYGPTLRKGDR